MGWLLAFFRNLPKLHKQVLLVSGVSCTLFVLAYEFYGFSLAISLLGISLGFLYFFVNRYYPKGTYVEQPERPLPRTDRIEDIRRNSEDASFTRLLPSDPKIPSELIKDPNDNLGEPEVIPFLAKLTAISGIQSQKQEAIEKGWIGLYSGSWNERELELIGYWLYKKFLRKNATISSVYDVGSAHFGQYFALLAFLNKDQRNPSQKFSYFAQDFLEGWGEKMGPVNGEFFPISLPSVKDGVQVDLVVCMHTLNIMAQNPLAIYASLFSFNRILKNNGHCIITVPERDSLPGMLDLLEKTAIDANFDIIESDKYRVRHTLTKEPFNISTFSFLFLKKKKDINDKERKKLIETSLQKDRLIENNFPKNHEKYSIAEPCLSLETGLKQILGERNPYFRLFLSTLEMLYEKNTFPSLNEEICRQKIRVSIQKIDIYLLNANVSNREQKLRKAANCYFYWLVINILILKKGTPYRSLSQEVYHTVHDVFYGSKDIRVHLDALDVAQIARLLKNLFEICQSEKIDLKLGIVELVDRNFKEC
jgi:hypothetical protein